MQESVSEDRVTTAKLLLLLERQGRRCALTGRVLTPDNCTLDHITPLAAGGAIGMSNVQLVTAEANAAKGVMSQDEFVQLCRDVASFTQRNRGWDYTSVEECMEDTVLDTPVVGSSDE